MTFLVILLTIYSIICSSLLVRNHYRYLNYVPSDRPEFDCSEGRHQWEAWKFKNTTSIYDGDKAPGKLPIERRDKYVRFCSVCMEPEYKELKG